MTIIKMIRINSLLKGEYNCLDNWRSGMSDIRSIVGTYGDEDCVVAYLKEKLGITILIKGSKKFFAMVAMRNDVDFGGYNYKMTRIELADFFRLTELNEGNNNNNAMVILDDEQYKKAKRTFVMEEMATKTDN